MVAVPKGAKLVAQSEEKPVVIGKLTPDELADFQEKSKTSRMAERKLARAKADLEDWTEGIRVAFRKRGILWKRVTGIDDETGEVMGKPEPAPAPKPEKKK